MTGKTGILLCGHGSRDANAIREFAVLAEMLDARLPDVDVDHGFLEFATPVIRTGLDALREKEIRKSSRCPACCSLPGT